MGSFYKPLCRLGEKTVLENVLKAFQSAPFIDTIILVTAQEMIDSCKRLAGDYQKLLTIIPGGKSRQQSVYLGLSRIVMDDPKYVLIHDGARPFLQSILGRVWKMLSASEPEGVIPVLPLSDTAYRKDTEDDSLHPIDRKKILRAQTPQGFLFSSIWRAHRWAVQHNRFDFSDDGSLLVAYNPKSIVRWVEGDRSNIKITYPEDLIIAQALIHNLEYREEEDG